MNQLRSVWPKMQSRLKAASVRVKVAGLALLAVSCNTVQPPRLVADGTLPAGDASRYILAADTSSEAWLSSTAVRHCLQSKGMLAGEPAQYFVQYAVAIRPYSSTLRTGKLADGPAPRARHTAKKGNDRIIYKLIVDSLSSGKRVYDLSFDVAYKPRNSTPESRAAQFCSAVGHNSR